MYSFAQRQDTKVFDEPLYAHYLSATTADAYHPGAEAILSSLENDGNKVIQDVFLSANSGPVLFFKNMCHHILDLDWSFLDKLCNIILIREPAEMLSSFSKQIEYPQMEDTAYPAQVRMYKYLKDKGKAPPILDSKQVLLNPEKVLSTLCKQIGIPFEKSMLNWKAGARPEDGVWAKYWYHNVHQSTGFNKYVAKEVEIPDYLMPLINKCQPLYEELEAKAIKAET
jgi:hypothetical protein